MPLNRKDKEKIEQRLQGTIACIPDAPSRHLTQADACSALDIARLAMIKDTATDHFWLRALDYDNNHLPSLIDRKTITGFKLTLIQKGSEEEHRLRMHLTEEVEARREMEYYASRKRLEESSNDEDGVGWDTEQAKDVLGSTSKHISLAHSKAPVEGHEFEAASTRSTTFASTPDAQKGDTLTTRTSESHEPGPSVSSSVVSVPATSAAVRTLPAFVNLPDQAVARILRLYLENASQSQSQYVYRLRELYWQVGRSVRRAMESMPTLWTFVHPRSPPAFIEASLQRSGAHLISLSLEGKTGDGKGCLSTRSFLTILKPQRYRWGTIEATIAPGSQSLRDLIMELETPIPSLRALSITVPGTSMTPTTLQFAFGLQGIAPIVAVLCGDTQDPTQITLGGLRIGPKPSPFSSLNVLDLSGQVQVTYMDLLKTFATAETLERLRLIDLDWLDIVESPLFAPETLLLPQMEDLILIETNRSTGLTNLLHFLNLATCVRFTLHTSDAEDFSDDLLAETVAPVIAGTLSNLLLSNEIYLYAHFAANELIWTGGAMSGDAGDVSFDIKLLCEGSKGPQEFLRFVCRTMEIAETHCFISVNVSDSLSGLVAPLPDLKHMISIPTLLGHDFEGMKVVHIAAEVFEDRLGYIRDMLIKGEWPHLTSMTLQYKQESQLEGVLELCPWLQHSLSALVQDLQSVYGLVEADTSEEGRAVIIFWDKLIALLQP